MGSGSNLQIARNVQAFLRGPAFHLQLCNEASFTSLTRAHHGASPEPEAAGRPSPNNDANPPAHWASGGSGVWFVSGWLCSRLPSGLWHAVESPDPTMLSSSLGQRLPAASMCLPSTTYATRLPIPHQPCA